MGEKRAAAKSFKDLIVWQKSHRFVLDVYRLSSHFPKSEIFGLTSQLRRAAISVPANIAEGFAKKTKPEKLRYMNIAQGSLEECRYFFLLIEDLKYGESAFLQKQAEEISKLLAKYSSVISASGS